MFELMTGSSTCSTGSASSGAGTAVGRGHGRHKTDAGKPKACQVPGCTADLSLQDKAAYCCKRRLCRHHMKSDAVLRSGYGNTLWRFCFQCGKLEPLSQFEGDKRTCKHRLHLRRQTAQRSGGHSGRHTAPAAGRASAAATAGRDASRTQHAAAAAAAADDDDLLQQQIKWQKQQHAEHPVQQQPKVKQESPQAAWQQTSMSQPQQQMDWQGQGDWQTRQLLAAHAADAQLLQEALLLGLQPSQQLNATAPFRQCSLPAATSHTAGQTLHRPPKRSQTFSILPAVAEAAGRVPAASEGAAPAPAASGGAAPAAAPAASAPAATNSAVEIDFDSILRDVMLEQAATEAATAAAVARPAAAPAGFMSLQMPGLSPGLGQQQALPGSLSAAAAAAGPTAMLQQAPFLLQQQAQLRGSPEGGAACASAGGSAQLSRSMVQMQQTEQLLAELAAGEAQLRQLFSADMLQQAAADPAAAASSAGEAFVAAPTSSGCSFKIAAGELPVTNRVAVPGRIGPSPPMMLPATGPLPDTSLHNGYNAAAAAGLPASLVCGPGMMAGAHQQQPLASMMQQLPHERQARMQMLQQTSQQLMQVLHRLRGAMEAVSNMPV